VADTGLCQGSDPVHTGTASKEEIRHPHAGLRDVLCRVEQLVMAVEEIGVVPSLANMSSVHDKAEQVLKDIKGLWKVYKL